MKSVRLLQIIFAAITILTFIPLIIVILGNRDKDTIILTAIYMGCGLLGSVICAIIKAVLQVRRIYVYTEEQEQEINEKLGYTQKEYDKLCEKKQWQQWQWTLGIPEIKAHIRRSKQKECPVCGTKLEWIRECTYVGFRHSLGATGGSYEKTYAVKKKRYCPDCQKMFD